MRGVHCGVLPAGRRPSGSSPHARGPPQGDDGRSANLGIIPACAGSTCSPPFFSGSVTDHPRMRGVHRRPSRKSRKGIGSSPHARGPRPGEHGKGAVPGIIPACAGSTHYWPDHSRPAQDHPRMRGVHRRSGNVIYYDDGSSPHARGPLLCLVSGCTAKRIIPACAGSTRESGRPVPGA